MAKVANTAGALLGVAALVGGGVAGVMPAVAAEAPASASEAVEVASDLDAASLEVAVEGSFTYDQNAVTSSETIRSTFAKATASVCASMPTYAAECTCWSIALSSGDSELIATVSEMTGEYAGTHIMGCACSSNIAGGGAIANAEVSGVSIEAIASMLGA